MENASKALIIAAGMLIAMMILGLIVLMFNSTQDYQKAEEQLQTEQQLQEFNKQYEAFNKQKLSGSEILSLANKMLDYDDRKKSQGYEELELTVNMKENTFNKGKILKKESFDTIVSDVDTIKAKASGGEKTLKELMAKYNASNIENSDYTNANVSIGELNKYISLYEFKNKTFKCTNVTYNSEGRIKSMTFEEV